jgi:hypothetical protein
MGFRSRIFGDRPRNIIGDELRTLTPENALEEVLCAARDGRQAIEEFVERVLQSQLFMPSESEPEVIMGGGGTGFRPIVAMVGSDAVVVACTAGSRTSTLINLDLRSGMLVDATWVLRMLRDRTGLWINPGWDAGLMMPAEGMRRFKADRGLV